MTDTFRTDRAFAEAMDAEDPLRGYRSRFSFPLRRQAPDGGDLDEEVLYFCGNSLGLMPKAVREYVGEELDSWAARAVDGHFHGRRPWYDYHEQFTEKAARLVGAEPGEVVIMNSLTVNLHLLMVSFYRPTAERYRIVIEDTAFPSDRYAVQSQARFHGHDPDDALHILKPREGEALLRTEDIEYYLQTEGEAVALVLLGGVNFYTGQAYDMERVTAAAHAAGAYCGFDLAHAAGNIPLSLHAWGTDFAAFCTYKYMNAGPGAVGGAFVHQKHGDDEDLERFAGWWGNDPESRFEMAGAFHPQRGAAGWQVSNAPVLSMAALLASLDLFDEVGMPALREKSEKLTAYLLHLIDDLGEDAFSVITPRDPGARGCQLSLRVKKNARRLQGLLEERGVVSDFRPPDVVRVAPVPLYNSFLDVWRLAQILGEAVR